MNVLAKALTCALVLGAVCVSLPDGAYAADPGVNQPGRAGNVGRAGKGADPGINQPGAKGNVGPAGKGADPGINQPGAAGNVGRDPGVNQPGAAGNRKGVRR